MNTHGYNKEKLYDLKRAISDQHQMYIVQPVIMYIVCVYRHDIHVLTELDTNLCQKINHPVLLPPVRCRYIDR